MNIVLHQDSERQLTALMNDAPHALLLSGPKGIGLSTVAQWLCSSQPGQVITVLPEKNEMIDLEKGVITVDSIRRLYDTTKTVSPSGRTIIIDYAERMAPAAQNAFLKLLEEPPESTRFILLTHEPELLLPTITSRSQAVALKPVSHEQSMELLDALKVTDETKRTQLLFIAGGLPAALTRLAQEESLFADRVAVVKDARTFITGAPYEKLLLAKKYKDSRVDALLLLEDALKLLRRTVAQNGDVASLRALNRYEQLHKRLSEQGNVRLQLSAAVMV